MGHFSRCRSCFKSNFRGSQSPFWSSVQSTISLQGKSWRHAHEGRSSSYRTLPSSCSSAHPRSEDSWPGHRTRVKRWRQPDRAPSSERWGRQSTAWRSFWSNKARASLCRQRSSLVLRRWPSFVSLSAHLGCLRSSSPAQYSSIARREWQTLQILPKICSWAWRVWFCSHFWCSVLIWLSS